MSEVLNRLVCASANGERAPVDRDDLRELVALYERSPGEHPTPEGPFHLNEYLANRAYGGPEEGGWWYDTGRFVACHGAFGTVDEGDGGPRREGELARGPSAGPARPVLGALHRLAGASHRATRRQRTSPPRGRATSETRPDGGGACASPPLSCRPSRVRPRSGLAPALRAARSPSGAGTRPRWPVSGRPVQGRRSPVMPHSCVTPAGAAP